MMFYMQEILKKIALLEHIPLLTCQDDIYNLLKVGTCFENSSKPLSIDLFLTTKNTHFQNTVAVCISLSDFNRLVPTVLIRLFGKNKPCEILYKDYKKFNSESFNENLQNDLCTTQVNTTRKFERTSVLNIHAPLERNYYAQIIHSMQLKSREKQ